MFGGIERNLAFFDGIISDTVFSVITTCYQRLDQADQILLAQEGMGSLRLRLGGYGRNYGYQEGVHEAAFTVLKVSSWS